MLKISHNVPIKTVFSKLIRLSSQSNCYLPSADFLVEKRQIEFQYRPDINYPYHHPNEQKSISSVSTSLKLSKFGYAKDPDNLFSTVLASLIPRFFNNSLGMNTRTVSFRCFVCHNATIYQLDKVIGLCSVNCLTVNI